MKKNMLHLLGALVIASMLCGSLEVKAMGRGWGYGNRAWNSARNTAQGWWGYRNNIYLRTIGGSIGTIEGAKAGMNFTMDAAHERDRRFLEAKKQGLSNSEAYNEATKTNWVKRGLEGRQLRKNAEHEKQLEKRNAKHEKWLKSYEERVRSKNKQ